MKTTLFLILLCFSLTITHAQTFQKICDEAMEKARDGKFELAIKNYTKAIDKFPNDTNLYNAYYNRAIAKMYLRDNEGAILDFDKAIDANSDHLKSYLNRGTAKKRLKNFEGAIADYTYVLGIDSNYTDALINRGNVYNELENKDAACKDWKRAAALGIKDAQTKVSNYCDGKSDTSAIKKYSIVKLTKSAENESYGFTEGQPIKVGSGYNGGPANQHDYLALLRGSDNNPVKYRRLGSCCAYPSKNGLFGMALIDRYEIIYKDLKGKTTTKILYISFYDYEEPMVPVGLKTK